jgi:hypothetical protein
VLVIVAEQDVPSEAGGVASEIPPVLPVDLCSMTLRVFSAALQKQRMHHPLDKVSEQDIDDVDAQFRCLRIAYREEEGVKMKLDAHHSKTSVQSFKECWTPLGKEYDALKEFCGSLASLMPGMSSVQSDFLFINWSGDPYSKSLTDFSLEAILHCKHCRSLESLSI